ncbi:SPOR domain-containing protein [Paenibacillus arenilitoris]|uniref:SPOR domain-containing protein n=1 Tax=Paenibacillus arenilitoris TaxID=2772299 RepID=A0A927CQL5_9BACL|nr:SPOR domain-containing protein [Paenibacillus arenilitoris]MBD2870456.1 SPOR domain-containing protein [Paenibacillus arenilitoris]
MNQKNRITYRFDRAGNTIPDDNRQPAKQQEAAPDKASSQTTAASSQAAKPAKVNVIPLYPSGGQHAVSENTPWNSPFQEDVGALEKLIRETDASPEPTSPPKTDGKRLKDKKPAKPIAIAPRPNEPDEREYRLPDQEESDAGEIREHFQDRAEADDALYDEAPTKPLRTTRMMRSSKGPSWFNVFLSVAGALATGALFGYLLLSLFTGASIWPGGSGSEPSAEPASENAISGDTPSGVPASPNTNKGGEEGPPAASGGKSGEGADRQAETVSLSGLDQTYYMLQFGVFSNTEGRDAAIAQLTGKGLAAAALTGSGDYRVYAGMAGDRGKAEAVRAQLSELELYIKEVSVAAPGELPYGGEEAEAQSFFGQTAELVRTLDELALAQLEQPSLSPVGEAAAKAWQEAHRKWTESAEAMRIGVTDETGKGYLEKIVQSMNKAAESMTMYNKETSRAALWSVQSELMKAVLAQKEWFESISAL